MYLCKNYSNSTYYIVKHVIFQLNLQIYFQILFIKFCFNEICPDASVFYPYYLYMLPNFRSHWVIQIKFHSQHIIFRDVMGIQAFKPDSNHWKIPDNYPPFFFYSMNKVFSFQLNTFSVSLSKFYVVLIRHPTSTFTFQLFFTVSTGFSCAVAVNIPAKKMKSVNRKILNMYLIV